MRLAALPLMMAFVPGPIRVALPVMEIGLESLIEQVLVIATTAPFVERAAERASAVQLVRACAWDEWEAHRRKQRKSRTDFKFEI